jgi:hypothetical protein
MAELKYAGEFIIEECTLCTVSGHQIDLKEQFTTLTIFEDINSNSITGNITFVDTNNLTANLSIVGQEKLKLLVATPNADDIYERDISVNFTDSPLYVYQVANSLNMNDRTKLFTLRFTTGEFVRNQHVRVQQSFTGEPSDIIKKVLRGEEYLNSKKEFFYEKTTNLFKLVPATRRPFDFINQLSKRCLSKEYNFSSSFRFYETCEGYFLRTIDSMMDRKNPKMIYRELTPSTSDQSDSALNLNNITSYNVMDSRDTVLQTGAGMLGSNYLEVDTFNKTYTPFPYNYSEDYDNQVHVDEHNGYGSQKAIPFSLAKDDYGNIISEYPNSVQYLQYTQRNKPSADGGLLNPAYDTEVDYNGHDIWLQRRRARQTSLDTAVTLQLRVPGNTTIHAGDLIGVVLKNQTDSESELDPYLSGKYLITNIRHEFKNGSGRNMHDLHIDCVRDSSQIQYPNVGVSISDSGKKLEAIIPKGDSDSNEIIF